MEQESLLVYCHLKVQALENKITQFLDQCKIPPKSMVVMNICDNCLLQGTTAPTADEIGGLFGKPAVHLKDNQSRRQTHHQVEVGPYNKFGITLHPRWAE